MRLTQKHFVYLGRASLVVVSALILYIVYVGWSPINRQAADRIQRGMTEQQVEQIFGRPHTFKIAIPAHTIGEKVFPQKTLKCWQHGRAECHVLFDSAGLVESVLFHELPDPGLIARIRAVFGR